MTCQTICNAKCQQIISNHAYSKMQTDWAGSQYHFVLHFLPSLTHHATNGTAPTPNPYTASTQCCFQVPVSISHTATHCDKTLEFYFQHVMFHVLVIVGAGLFIQY